MYHHAATDVDAALVGLVDRSKRVLLARTLARPHVWQPVGGHVEGEDADPASAAVREVWEETGIRVSVEDLRPAGSWPSDTGPGEICFFLADVENRPLVPQQEELAELRWVPLSSAAGLPALPATGAFLRSLATLQVA